MDSIVLLAPSMSFYHELDHVQASGLELIIVHMCVCLYFCLWYLSCALLNFQHQFMVYLPVYSAIILVPLAICTSIDMKPGQLKLVSCHINQVAWKSEVLL